MAKTGKLCRCGCKGRLAKQSKKVFLAGHHPKGRHKGKPLNMPGATLTFTPTTALTLVDQLRSRREMYLRQAMSYGAVIADLEDEDGRPAR